MANDERAILPSMSDVGGNTKLTWKVSKMLTEKLTREEFKEFEQWIRVAKSKQILFEQRYKHHKF